MDNGQADTFEAAVERAAKELFERNEGHILDWSRANAVERSSKEG